MKTLKEMKMEAIREASNRVDTTPGQILKIAKSTVGWESTGNDEYPQIGEVYSEGENNISITMDIGTECNTYYNFTK